MGFHKGTRRVDGPRRLLRRGGVLAGAALLAAAVVSSFHTAGAITVTPTAPFNQCPAVGYDTSCAVLVVINPNGSMSILFDPTQGPFDGVEDTLVGVVNQSDKTVNSIDLATNTDAFGFDGDGLCAFTFTGSTGCPFDSSGYAGPGTSFSNISSDSHNGTVNFGDGLRSGGTAFFSLEEALTATSFQVGDTPATGTCTKTYTGTVTSAVLVAKNSTTCIDNANVVNGATISVPAGAELVVTNSTVKGSIVASKPHAMTICGSTFGGSITVSGSTAFVLIGDGGDGSSNNPCAANTIKGSVSVTKATGGVEVGGNTISGSTTVSNNIAPTGGTPTEDAATEIEGNTISGSLICLSNNPAPVNDNVVNTVHGSRVGQCKGAF